MKTKIILSTFALSVLISTSGWAGDSDGTRGGGSGCIATFMRSAFETADWLTKNGVRLTPQLKSDDFLIAINPDQLQETTEDLQYKGNPVDAFFDGKKILIRCDRLLHDEGDNRRQVIAHEILRKMSLEGDRYEISRQISYYRSKEATPINGHSSLFQSFTESVSSYAFDMNTNQPLPSSNGSGSGKIARFLDGSTRYQITIYDKPTAGEYQFYMELAKFVIGEAGPDGRQPDIYQQTVLYWKDMKETKLQSKKNLMIENSADGSHKLFDESGKLFAEYSNTTLPGGNEIQTYRLLMPAINGNYELASSIRVNKFSKIDAAHFSNSFPKFLQPWLNQFTQLHEQIVLQKTSFSDCAATNGGCEALNSGLSALSAKREQMWTDLNNQIHLVRRKVRRRTRATNTIQQPAEINKGDDSVGVGGSAKPPDSSYRPCGTDYCSPNGPVRHPGDTLPNGSVIPGIIQPGSTRGILN